MRGKKTSTEKREEVKAVIFLNPEVANKDVARQTNLPESTVREIKQSFVNSDEFNEVRAEKKREFIGNAWKVVTKALELTERRFDKALNDEVAFDKLMDSINNDAEMNKTQKAALLGKVRSIEMSSIRDIAIALGTIYDKQALASGEATQITESKKSIPDLVKETETKLIELKKLVNGS